MHLCGRLLPAHIGRAANSQLCVRACVRVLAGLDPAWVEVSRHFLDDAEDSSPVGSRRRTTSGPYRLPSSFAFLISLSASLTMYLSEFP